MIARALLAAVVAAATLAPATALAVASAELYRTQPDGFGRFEARIRYAPGGGVVSSFFLWKDGSEMPGVFWNELDFEKLDGDCRMQTNALYGSPVASTEQVHMMVGQLCDGYHDYAMEWTPTYIAWFIDGREVRRNTGAVAEAFAQNAPDGMQVHFNVWPGNADFGGVLDPSVLPVRQYISWVQFSSFQNGNFTLAWREDFNGSTVPAGWAVGTWPSPKDESTHNPANVTFSNGISILSLTADQNTGFTGSPPADNGGAGGMSGGAGGSGGAAAGAGGMPKGGAPAGGASSTGGAPIAGGSAGDAGKGGSSAGGVGGAPSGGTTSGGAPTGGTSTGGTPSGGTPAATGGVTTTGGTPTVAGSPGGGVVSGTGGKAGPSSGSPPSSGQDSGCHVSAGRWSATSAALIGYAALAGLFFRRRSIRRANGQHRQR